MYTVYTANYCPTCTKVVDFIEKNKFACEVVNTDEQDVDPPIPIMIFPALLEGNRLIAYGSDINDFMVKNGEQQSS